MTEWQGDVARRNARVLLEYLYRREPSTLTELRDGLELPDGGKLSRSTVERMLEVLAELGVVGRSEPVTLVSGRPAALYRFQPEFGHLLALDIGANTVRARVDDLAGPRSGQGLVPAGGEPEPLPLDPAEAAKARLAAVGQLADQALAEAGITRGQVRAVTVATPGIVDSAGVILACGVIPEWAGDRLRAAVSSWFPGAVVSVDNDANLAALAEQRFGVAGDAGEVVAVSAGRRIGFGVLRGGTLYRGAHHQAGETANVRGSSWGRASGWLYRHHKKTQRLFAAARAGEPAKVAMVEDLADLLSIAFAEVVHTLDPELIVLGGALSLAGPTILDPVAERFKRACHGTQAPHLMLSTLGRRAPLLGAAEHARRRAVERLLDDALPHGPNATPRSRR